MATRCFAGSARALLALCLLPLAAAAQSPTARMQQILDSTARAHGWIGATFAVAFPDGGTAAVATGWSDTTRRIAMRPGDRMLQGSVGKTYVSAVALQLVAEGKLDLDAKISTYLGDLPYFARIPNAHDITVRQLMNHTSGLVRYEFQPAFTAALRSERYRVWTPADRLAFILDTQAPFAAGQGWEYSDTNYIVLGMIIERLTGRAYYDELQSRLLRPLALRNTIPSDRPDLPGVVNGYAGPRNELGGYDASLVNGRFAANPGLEWTGGGVASTTEDLARWAKLLYEGRVLDSTRMAALVDGVPARLGRDVRYGLGVIIRPTPIGTAWGHSGFFPGYATEMIYFPERRIALAVQVNVTDPYPRGMVPLLIAAARALTP